MRRNFAQVLRDGHIDIKNEYMKLWNMYNIKDIPITSYTKKSIRDYAAENFRLFRFRGTCLSLDEFDRENGFVFYNRMSVDNIDLLIGFAEYFYNIMKELRRVARIPFDIDFVINHIECVIELVGYMRVIEDGFFIFVEKSKAAIAVSETLAAPDSYKVLSYNHYSMKGNIEAKKTILVQMATLLEPQEKILKEIDAGFKNDLFYAFNNMNLRHNNIDPSAGKSYKIKVAEMSLTELESWYDEIYQMCLLAFLRIEHIKRKRDFDELKKRIESKE